MNVFSLPPLPCDPKPPFALMHKGFRTLLRKCRFRVDTRCKPEHGSIAKGTGFAGGDD